ncbi:MAG: response regulator [Gammaproteobacteria bacterium]|nr:response regulator [Gammaproteobacteria bacterium]
MSKAYQILIVEDNDIIQRIISTTFTQKGWEVFTASTAKQARLLANAQPYSLIIMDIGLPDGNGIEVSESIRGNPQCPSYQVPIIAITAHFSRPDDRARCLAAGINEVLEKPVSSAKLCQIIDAILPYAHLPIYDLNQAVTFHGNAGEANKIFHLFFDELEQAQPLMQQGFESKDWGVLRKVVHRQHGAALYCGTTRLNACLHDMETLLLTSPIDENRVTKHYHWMLENMALLSTIDEK